MVRSISKERVLSDLEREIAAEIHEVAAEI